MASDDEISTFLSSPLVRWVSSLVPGTGEVTWPVLAQGVVLFQTLESLETGINLEIDTEPSDTAARARNMKLVVNSIKKFYSESLNQMLMLPLPSPRDLSLIPPSSTSLQQMENLLLLLLGAAVQSEHKQDIVIAIKNLPLDTQHGIVDRIRAVTDNPNLVWNKDFNNPTTMGESQRDVMYQVLVEHATRLIKERDELNEQLSTLLLEVGVKSPHVADGEQLTTASNHAMVEVAEYKAKARRLRQQLEEKTEQLSETKEELEKLQDITAKLKTENLELCQDARAAKTYRDELDVLRERAEKVDKLEAELLRYKDKMNDIEFFKSRVEELREDNRILVETKEMLEEQLAGSRKRCEVVLGLENDIIKYKGEIERLQHDREHDRNKIKDLAEENAALTLSQKNSLSESQSLQAEMQVMKGNYGKDLNILSDQLGKDAVSRVHRLELENQRLQRELEAAKTDRNKIEKEAAYEFEMENKKVQASISRLEEQGRRDNQALMKVEQEVIEARREKENLQTVVDTLKQQNKNLQIEKDTEVESLSKQVTSLNARAAHTQNQQLALVQEENKKLISELTVLQTQVTKASHEKERLAHNVNAMKVKLESFDESEHRRQKLEREKQDLVAELEKLSLIQDQYEMLQDEAKTATDQVSSLNERLTQNAQRLDEAQSEAMKLKVENGKLLRKVDSIKNENQNITWIEQEKDSLKQTVAQMKATIDNLQKTQAKQDELEIKAMTANNENLKLQRQMETMNRKVEELDRENNEIETENKKMQKTIETLKVTARRVNQLESENLELEGQHHKVERENKSLVREIERLKQTMEVKDLSLDENASKLAAAERELEKHRKEVDMAAKHDSKQVELEAANQELASQCMMDKRALIDLREELVKEKIAAEKLSAQIEAIVGQLAAVGISHKQDGSLQGIDKIQRMKEEVRKVTIAAVERSKQIEVKNTTEERVNVLQAERDELSNELAKLRVAAVGREDKETAWTNQLNNIQEEMVVINKEKACLQVENRTLQSQSSSLLAQINTLQSEHSKLESELSRSTQSEKEMKQELNQLLADQTRLQRLHDQLQSDYDRLSTERDDLKLSERTLRMEISKLKDSAETVSQGQDDIIKAKEAIDMERETLKMDKKTLSNLRSEHSRLKDDFRSLFTANERMKTEYCNLQTDYKTLKTENNQLKLRHTDLQGKVGDAREQITILDVENTKITNRCEVLHQLNLSLEEDRKSLMSQVSLLLSQYHDLLTQTLDDKEHFHEEEREYSDKMNNLRRQKEKLEEKIMEQYKKMENSTPKKKGIGFTLVRKMRKAGSNMFLASPSGRSRSRNQDTEQDSSSLGSGGNDSMDSGGQSPAENMLGGDTVMEMQGEKMMFRRGVTLPPMVGGHETDSDAGNIADNDSLASYLSGHLPDNDLDLTDHIPTRDTGLMAPRENTFNSSRDRDNRDRENREIRDNMEFDTNSYHSTNLTNLTTPQSNRKSFDKQPRSISRVYLSSGEEPVGGGRGWRREGEEPRLTSWRRTHDESLLNSNNSSLLRRIDDSFSKESSLPSFTSETNLPPIPARRPSAAGDSAPNRPPKPNRSNNNTDDEDSKKDKDSNNSDSSIWYEYGCV